MDLATRLGEVVFLKWIPFRKFHSEIAAWLAGHQVPHFLPEPLPGALYADANHPLTAGYDLLAKRLGGDTIFQKWISTK